MQCAFLYIETYSEKETCNLHLFFFHDFHENHKVNTLKRVENNFLK